MDNSILYKIEGNGRPLKEVFGQRYVIDYFQREYKWERRHLEQLIYDLDFCFFESYQDGDDEDCVADYKPYFLGPYIIYRKKNVFSIIDGQQRLTTLTLLMIYMMKNYPELRGELEKLVYTKFYRKEGYVIQVDEREHIMDHLYKDTPIGEEELTVSTLNLLERYEDIDVLFPERLRDPDILPVFTCWLKEKLIFVEILSYSDSNAYTIFETMNDRGFNLTSTEMMKSFLLSKIADEQLRVDCDAVWKQNIQELAKLDKESEAEFFRAWLRGKYLTEVKDNADFLLIGTGFHRWVKTNFKHFNLKEDSDIEDFISNEMSFYVSVFVKIRNAERKFSKGLECIVYQAPYAIASSLVYPLYLSCINQSDTEDMITKKLAIVAHFLDCFVSNRIMNGQPTGQSSIRSIFYNLIVSVRGMDYDTLKKTLGNILSTYAVVDPQAPVINRLPYKFLRYYQYRMNLFVLQLLNSDYNFYYDDYKSSKLVYCFSKESDNIVRAETYRQKNKYPLYGVAFFDEEGAVEINAYYNLVKNLFDRVEFLPEELRENLGKAKDELGRGLYIYKYVREALWGWSVL